MVARSHKAALPASTLSLEVSSPSGPLHSQEHWCEGLWIGAIRATSSLCSHLSTGPGCQALKIDIPPSVTVNVGDEARLVCKHDGNKPNITWWYGFLYNSNISIPSVFMGSGQGLRGDELVIPNVNKSHGGLYRCQAEENGKRKFSCSTYLRVRSE